MHSSRRAEFSNVGLRVDSRQSGSNPDPATTKLVSTSRLLASSRPVTANAFPGTNPADESQLKDERQVRPEIHVLFSPVAIKFNFE